MEFSLRLEIDFGVSVGGIFKLLVQPHVLDRVESWELGRDAFYHSTALGWTILSPSVNCV